MRVWGKPKRQTSIGEYDKDNFRLVLGLTDASGTLIFPQIVGKYCSSHTQLLNIPFNLCHPKASLVPGTSFVALGGTRLKMETESDRANRKTRD